MNDQKWQSFLNKIPKEFADKGPGARDFNDEAFHMANEGLAYGGTNLEYLMDCNKILDIGCGVAHTVKILRDMGKYAYGITINTDEVKESIERLKLDPEKVELGDVHDLPWVDGTFDGVILWEIIEHVLSPQAVIWEAARVLRNGGKLMLFTPPDVYIEFSVHIILPTQRQLFEMFAKAGIVVEVIRDWGGESARYWCRKVSGKSLEEIRDMSKNCKVIRG